MQGPDYEGMMLRADQRTREGSVPSRQYWVRCRDLLADFAYGRKQYPTESQLRWLAKIKADLR